MTLKEFWDKAKNFFVVAFFVVGIVACFLFFQEKKAYELIKFLEDRAKAREKELADLKLIADEKAKRDKEIEETYQRVVQELKDKHRVEIDKLNEEKKRELQSIVERYKDDPEGQAQRLTELFGIKT